MESLCISSMDILGQEVMGGSQEGSCLQIILKHNATFICQRDFFFSPKMTEALPSSWYMRLLC